jgi:2,4-dienoyl-CoA reductase (NADPH2)
MTMSRYPILFSPIRLGPVKVENRIVFSAHLTNYASNGLPTAQHAAYYASRARGGAGLIITEEHSVHPTDWPYEKMIHAWKPEVVSGYRLITDAVHQYGTPIFAQINHNGGQGSGMYSRLPLWAPSPVADPLFREVPLEIDEEKIEEVIASYADVALRCKQGGFDGVELQCSHSSIVRQFLSPATNLRSDQYGGDLENRARLLLEITEAVRHAVGEEMAIGVRLCGDELIEGGTGITEAVEVAKMIEQQGVVDYINTSIGVATATLFTIEASMQFPPGYALFIPSAIRYATNLPVVGVGRIKDPQQAEKALSEGYCDLVGMVRAQIADPDFANKAANGTPEKIRLCLSCNQECVGRMGLNRWLGCIENPRTGKESHLPPRPARTRKRVLVIGAGPGGLQTAIAASSRGHEVLVLEATPHPGGQIRLAASIPHRAELFDLVRNQMNTIAELGVKILYETPGTLRSIKEIDPSVVVVATGSIPQRPSWLPAHLYFQDHIQAGSATSLSHPHPVTTFSEQQLPGVRELYPPSSGGPDKLDADSVEEPIMASRTVAVDVRHVLEGMATPRGRVVIVDDLGFHQATSVAELLADRGCSVTVTTSAMIVGQDLGITLDLEGWNMRAAAKGITQLTELVPEGISEGEIVFLHHPSGNRLVLPADWVVLAVPPEPSESLYFELIEEGIETYRVGDAVAPRKAHAAVLEGNAVGEML